MSEREDDCDHFGLWLWLIIAGIAIVVLSLHGDHHQSQLRDLQRRVGQLEAGVRR